MDSALILAMFVMGQASSVTQVGALTVLMAQMKALILVAMKMSA
jgi:hypothetical protein